MKLKPASDLTKWTEGYTHSKTIINISVGDGSPGNEIKLHILLYLS